MRLVFVRHGEPDYANDCLTDNGKIQAKSTAERLKKENISEVYASPMGRAKETASFTAKKLGLDVQILDFMHEIDWGDIEKKESENSSKLEYDGHPWTLAYKLLTENPEYVGSPAWRDHHCFRDNICMEYYELVSTGMDEFLSRFGLLREGGLYKCVEEDTRTIALFAHGGSGAVMFSHLLSLPFPYVLTSMPYGVCSVSVVDFTAQNGDMVIPRLELFNDMGHIESFRQEKLHFAK